MSSTGDGSGTGGGSLLSRLSSLRQSVQQRADQKGASAGDAKKRKLDAIRQRREKEKAAKSQQDRVKRARTTTERRHDAVQDALARHIMEYQLISIEVDSTPLCRTGLHTSWGVDAKREGRLVVDALSPSVTRDFCWAVLYTQEREYAFQNAAGRMGLAPACLHHLTPGATPGAPAEERVSFIVSREVPHATPCASPEFVRDNLRLFTEFLKRIHHMEVTGLSTFAPSNVFSDIISLYSVVVRRMESATAPAEGGQQQQQEKEKEKEKGGGGSGSGGGGGGGQKVQGGQGGGGGVPGVGLRLPANYDELHSVAVQWMEILAQSHPDPQGAGYVCHNSLRYDRFLVAQEEGRPAGEPRLYLTGFSDAGVGDRYFDLANFSRLNGLSDDDDVVLLRSYFGPFSKRQLACFKMLKIASHLKQALEALVAYDFLPDHPRRDTLLPEAEENFKAFEAAALAPTFVQFVSDELIR